MRGLKIKLIVSIFIFLGVLSGCAQDNDVAPESSSTKPNELVLAIGGEPEDGFDPTTGWGRYGSPLFQSTLLKHNHEFQIVNDLAEGYSVSKDGLEWIVKIRSDAKFSDGELLTAEDVVFTFETAKSSASVIDLSNLNRVEAVDEHTIKFYLEKAQSTFINMLISTGIVPEHAYGEKYNEEPIGSGPYKLVQWDKGQQLIVEANENYYGKKPFFTKLTFLFLSEDTAFAAAKAGDVDIVSIPPSYTDVKLKNMKLLQFDTVDNRGIMFPYVPAGGVTEEEGLPIGHDVTSDQAIRKALNIGINRQSLVDGVLEGFGTPAYTVADKLPWWNPETVIQDGNMDEAINILESAGWMLNNRGIREKNELEASFTLYYPAGDHVRQSLSMAFADMVKGLGIEVRTEGKSWNELEKLMYSNPIMMGWGSYDPLEMYNLFSSETKGIGYYNTNFYENAKVDDYMSKALSATTEEEANEYWQKAQWDGNTGFSAHGDAPWAWLVNLQHLYFVREQLEIGEQKIQPHGHGWPLTADIEEWYWKEN